jgi:hypothetical protein
MIVPLTVAAALQSAATQPMPNANALESLFFSACLNGSAKLDQRAIPISFDAMPALLRRKLGTPSTGKVWKFEGKGDAYFYTLQYTHPGMTPNVCGVASDNLPFNSAADAVALRIGASRYREPGSVTTEWWHPDAGYMALASKVQRYTVLQVNWLSEKQRKRAAAAHR